MGFSESIKLTIDVVTGNARGSLKSLSADVKEADGAFAKMKTGAGGAFDMLKQNAATAALGAGTALVAFGAQSVAAFQETALGAASLRDSLGVTAEEASRLQEVAGDLGIGVGSLESAIGKMNIAVDKSPEKFDELGAAIVRNKDGTVNVNETFLQTIDALNKIPDATARANAAQQIFGKGWKDISELVTTGADGVREAMASVESSKIIDDNEIAQARRFRDMMDQLKGMLESVSLEVGSRIVPALSGFIGTMEKVLDVAKRLDKEIPEGAKNAGLSLSDLGSTWSDIADDFKYNAGVIKDTLTGTGEGIDVVVDKTVGLSEETRSAIPEATAAVIGLGQGYLETAEDANVATGAFGLLGGSILDIISAAAKSPEELAALKEEMAEDEAQVERLTEAHDALTESITTMADAARDAADTQVEAEEATADWNDTLATYDQQVRDAAGDQAKLNDVQSTGRDRAIAMADATTDAFDAQSRANGVTLQASDRLGIWNGSMLEAARSAQGPLRDSIVNYIATANQIPPEKVTEILANPDYAGIAAGSNALNKASETRTAYINAEARNVGSVAYELDKLAAQRFAVITAVNNVPRGVNRAQATGGIVRPGQGVTLVGEEGPELVTMPAGSMVHTASETRSMARELGASGGAAVAMNITINAGLGVSGPQLARELQDLLDQQNRRNGRGR
jgi:hypothetical protein